MRPIWVLGQLGPLSVFIIGLVMREANIFLFAVAGVVVLLTLAIEPPSSKTWWGGLITAGVIALFALTYMILSGGVAWHGVNPWGPVLIFGGPAVGFRWIWIQIRESSDRQGASHFLETRNQPSVPINGGE
jgi:hypothetical protein